MLDYVTVSATIRDSGNLFRHRYYDILRGRESLLSRQYLNRWCRPRLAINRKHCKLYKYSDVDWWQRCMNLARMIVTMENSQTEMLPRHCDLTVTIAFYTFDLTVYKAVQLLNGTSSEIYSHDSVKVFLTVIFDVERTVTSFSRGFILLLLLLLSSRVVLLVSKENCVQYDYC